MHAELEGTGLEVIDLRIDEAFRARSLHQRDAPSQIEALQRLSRALVENPDTILQELVNSAVTLCGADSAGISIETRSGNDEKFYHWVATAGDYSGFLDAILPRYPSACGVCLERGRPQHFTVSERFFEILGVTAPVVTDGILLPWSTDDTRGTIFVMAHGRIEAFDENDTRVMTMLADFAAMGFRQQKQHDRTLVQERTNAAARMANRLAHQINNPLQSMVNNAYLLAEGVEGVDPKHVGQALANDIERLSGLVKKLLELPEIA